MNAITKPKDLLCVEGISALAFNNDFTKLALSKRDKNIYIYELQGANNWVQVHVLESVNKKFKAQHLQYITMIDWHPLTNAIISASQDRDIFVWKPGKDGITWQPELVFYKTKIGVLDVKWNKRGDKFVCCTGSKLVSTGYFDEKIRAWSCMSHKEHKSSVNCVQFDNSSLFVLSGSNDLKVIISSAYIDQIDDVHSKSWGNLPFPKTAFGEIIATISTGAWVNDVAWLPDDSYALATSHNSTITLIDTKDASSTVLDLDHGPLSKIIVLNENKLLCVGFDRQLYLYELNDNKLNLLKKLTGDNSSETTTEDNSGESGGVKSLLRRFESGLQKKQSVVVSSTGNNDVNAHYAPINSCWVNTKNNVVYTSDQAGFFKTWKL